MTEPAGPGILLAPTACAICGIVGNADIVYPPTYDESSFNERVFSARRLPDSIHYRIVRCRKCGLVRSDPAAGQASLSELYRASSLDYGAEIPNLRRTYGRYLARAKRHARGRSFLEIGCGSGFMLEEARAQGYEHVRGVEPSLKAVAAASPAVRDLIEAGIMRRGIFEEAEFDTVCMFQVLDHLPEPGAVLDQVRAAVSKGGVLLCLNHNVESLSARALGERSPIIDIEHCYLYSLRTMKLLFESNGFEVIDTGPVTNTLSLRHLLHLLPIPTGLKSPVGGRLGQVQLRLPLGNLYTVGRRM